MAQKHKKSELAFGKTETVENSRKYRIFGTFQSGEKE